MALFDVNFLRRLRHEVALRAKEIPLAYDLIRLLSRAWDGSEQYYFLLDVFRASKEISILQVGANDGIRDDPIREFIVFNPNCKAWLVEPIPMMQKELCKNYSRLVDKKRLSIIPYAISHSRKTLELYQVSSSRAAKIPDYAKGIISSNPAHLLNRTDLDLAQEDIEEIKVKAITANELIEIVGSEIDLMIIDVEGMEEELLRGFPWQTCSPTFILYESYHLSLHAQSEIASLLYSQGYCASGLGKDTAAVKKDWLASARSINPKIFKQINGFKCD